MNTLNFSVFINAPKEKVWNTMLEDVTYREWTKPFNETSYFQGDWSEGSKMLFLGTDKEGKNEGGMVSRIAKNIPFTHISIQHLGVLENGIEKPWEGEGFENYTYTEKDGGTQVDIEMTNIPDEYMEMMNTMWPKALEVLRVVAEK
jgi:hypothetical protein